MGHNVVTSDPTPGSLNGFVESRLRLRGAIAADIPFLVDGIIAADKSGTDTLSYCTIFNLSEPEFRSTLGEILAENVTGQELCVSDFKIAEVAGTPAAAVCAWVEGTGGKPSGVLKGNLLLHFIGRDRIAAAALKLKLVDELTLHRSPGSLQIESVYVAAAFRGRGLFGQLLAAQLDTCRKRWPATSKAQIVLMKGNTAALRAYERAGFAITQERRCSSPAILDLLPDSCKVLMEKSWL